jgi:restriction endonuclease
MPPHTSSPITAIGLNKKRRQLVRTALTDVIARVDDVIRSLRARYKDNADRGRKLEDSVVADLQQHVQEIETMLGSSLPRPDRWTDLRRHIHFGQVGDLLDIVELDWPKVKAGLSAGLYDRNEPVPVEVSDLGVLAAAQPRGTVATRLHWESLSAEAFERLLFSLISGARGYENPEWLMRTNAPDRGRDLSVTRVAHDSLGGVIRSRVIIQCKHWLDKSVSVADVAELRAQMKLWEPPRVDVLVIATSGRFSGDAVAWIEKHNMDNHALRIEMWPESHLERLLAERPALIADFRLR